MSIVDKIKFDEKGLVPAVLQDIASGQVLMVAYMNRESLQKTIETGRTCFWSRSRQELWEKGATSGNYQQVEEIRVDCDNDTLLVLVKPAGPACHTGEESCFYRKYDNEKLEEAANTDFSFLNKAVFLEELYNLIKDRQENPVEGSYTNYLFNEGVDKICKKLGEETAEVIIGAKNDDNQEIIYETGDLIYHLLVLLNQFDITLEEVISELESRHG